ncbi:MAG TPA: CYTH and CHAD domain-containing protein [Citricoccus sp.]
MRKTRPWVSQRQGRFWTTSSPVGRVEAGLGDDGEALMAGFVSSGVVGRVWDHGAMVGPVHVEIERKFDVEGQTSLPRLNGVGGVARVRYRPPVALEAVYFDTAERDLSANRVTLRRRSGGPDAGWHVKIASGEHRLELQSPWEESGRHEAGPGGEGVRVPEHVRDLVQVHVRGKVLAPVARLSTLRSVVDLMDGRGRPLAEVCDDQVAAMAVGVRAEARVQHWREWEVEVVDPGLLDSALSVPEAAGQDVAARGAEPATGTVRFLDAVGAALQEAGAQPSATGSKAEKVLGRAADPLDPQAVPLPDGGPAGLGAVLTRTVRAELKVLKGWDPLVRRDVEDSIHQFRVACRTLRSVLQTYGPLLEPEATRRTDQDLRRLGRLLSGARDAEVVLEELEQRLEALPGGAGGPVAALIPPATLRRLRRALAEDYARARRKLLKRMRAATYAEVLDRLDAYARDVPLHPALGAAACADAAGALEPLATEQVDAVLDLAARATAEEDPQRRVEQLHEVRKGAKRLRYAVTAVQDATGLDLGPRLASRMETAKKLQSALGEHRDSVMVQEHVIALRDRAVRAGEDTFGYGVLFAGEVDRQRRAEKRAAKLVRRLARSD